MRTTYIHIGTHKTGTTSIQWALNHNRAALDEHGFLYPRTGIPADHVGHHNIAWELYGSTEFRSVYGSIDDLLMEIRGSDRNVLLSSELFGVAAHNPERFASLVARLKEYTPRIVIIVYFRNQAGYARSLYFELLKHGYRETFDTFLSIIVRDRMVRLGELTRYSFCYRDFLALLPADQAELVVRYYDRTRPGSVTSDFLSVLGLKPEDLDIAEELRANLEGSIGDAFLSFYQNRRKRRLGADDARLIQVVQKALADKKVDLSLPSKQRLVAAFDASNQYMNTQFSNCALASVAMENPDPGPVNLHLESLFSEATVQLVCDVAKELDADVADAESARDAAIAERDIALAARDTALASRDTVLGERGEFAAKYASATAERDALMRDRDELMRERDGLMRECDEVVAQRESFSRAHDALRAERDAMLRSRSWRMTRPLRDARGWAARLLRP